MRSETDITPPTNLLKAYRLGVKVDYLTLIGEAVDNSLDANARNIRIDFKNDEVTIQDDGSGIARMNVTALGTLGFHQPQETTKLGRYGIGIKSQALAAGDILNIWSITSQEAFSIRLNWPKIERSGEWQIPKVTPEPHDINEPTGTRLRISRLRKAVPTSFAKIEDFIQAAFHPALESGRSIRLNGHDIRALPEPAMRDVIDQTISLSDGRSAHVRAGILLKPGKPNQVHVGYEHRIIMPGCGYGCAEFGNMPNMLARVQLSGSWGLATYKNELTDEEQDEELRQALYDCLLPLLRQAEQEQNDMATDQIEQKLNNLLPPELQGARPDHTKKKGAEIINLEKRREKQRGKVDPNKSSERKSGPAKALRRPKNLITINFRGNDADHGVGIVDLYNRPHSIMLAKDNPTIAELKLAARTNPAMLRAIYAIAICLYVQGQAAARAQTGQTEMGGLFGKDVASLLAMQSIPLPDVNAAG